VTAKAAPVENVGEGSPEPAPEPAAAAGDAPAEDKVADKPETAPAEIPGKVIMKAGRGDRGGPIKVSVDKRTVGNTPLELELKPGKYDIVFSRDGKRKFKRITVESGQETKLTASVPK
jgi:hypothetical protein